MQKIGFVRKLETCTKVRTKEKFKYSLNIIEIMRKYFLLIGFVVALVLISGCIQPTTPETLVCNDGTIVTPPESCPPSAPDISPSSADNDIFDFLTKYVWQDAGCSAGGLLPPTCTTLELRRNGNYSWTAFSDYPERSQSGKWNFQLTTEDSGTILLDNGSVISFQKSNNDLIFGLHTFMPSEEIEHSSEETEKKRDSLPEIVPSEMYSKLIENSWGKANDFDLGTSPELIILKDDGRFFASYRNNECTHEGWWSLDKETLMPVSDPNNCDVRGINASIAASNEKPAFENGLLVFYRSPYYNAENETEKKTFIFDRYTRSVKVSGEYSGLFTENNPTSIDFTFQNVDDIEKELGQFKISIQKLRPTDNAFTADGEELVLFEKDYTGISLSPNEKYQETITITPTTSGENVNFNINLDFKDKRQTYSSKQSYLVEIE